MLRPLETGTPRETARLAVLIVHGRWGTAALMAGLAERFALEGVSYVCPEADGNSWYPGRFMEPLEVNQPALGNSLAAVEALADELAAGGFGADRLVLCGFSQGACLAAQLLVRRPQAYAGAILFTGGLIGPPGTVWRAPGRIPGKPVLLTCGDADEWIPLGRVQETAAVLKAFGASVETVIYPGREHLVSDDEVARGRRLLSALLAAAGRAKPTR